jgi:predicted Zn-dependent protease with MMP-like domain
VLRREEKKVAPGSRDGARAITIHRVPAGWRVIPSEFRKIVQEALAELPEEFAGAMENVVVVVEEEPDPELDDTDDETELLGIFRGTPLTDRHHDDVAPLPPVIAIFRGPILRVCSSREEAIDEIQQTVIHEIGHLFGLEDEGMPF